SIRPARFNVRPGRSGPKTSRLPRSGITSARSARALATAGFTRWKRSSPRSLDIKMSDNPNQTDESAAVDGEWQFELRAIYEQLDRVVARAGPVCELSGRCCRFDEYGHPLFVSTAEVRYLLAVAPPAQRPLDHGATCPWQDSRGHCTARDA